MHYSKKALWLACNSEFGERLIEIAKKHISLAKELSFNRWYMIAKDREIVMTRIETLRQERDGIILLFEERRREA
ncbi:hypothetical protein D3C74_206950 [compost metagenome]